MIAEQQSRTGIPQDIHMRYMAVDLLVSGFLSLLLLLLLFFPSRFVAPGMVFDRLLISLGGYMAVLIVVRRSQAGVRAFLRITALATLLMYLFDEMQHFQQLLFSSWLDGIVLDAEAVIFGGNVVAMLEALVHPYVTEGLMFTYVLYMPLLPGVAALLYFRSGHEALSDYLMNISLIFLVCFSGYVLFPVASPMHFSPTSYTVPLEGGLFTWCGEWLRHNQHYPGGSVPSAHCAAATGVLIMLRRHYKNGYFVFLPIVLLLYVATMYGRYHYLTDVVTGILVGFLVVRVSPHLVMMLNGALGHMRTYQIEPGIPVVENIPKAPLSGRIRSMVAPPRHDTFLTEARTVNDSTGGGTT